MSEEGWWRADTVLLQRLQASMARIDSIEFTAIRLAEVAGEASLDVDTLAYDAVRAALNKKHAHNWEDGFRACNNYGTSALSYY